MHIHILGICGTFMAGIAALARAQGHRVTGSDAAAYPPMSTQLEALGITVLEGYEPAHLEPTPDKVVVGNVVTRGNAAMEAVLDRGLPYISGPQWLSENLLSHQHVLAVSGTHGKTTTSGMVAWILAFAGLEPGYLIGGVPGNFETSACLGGGKFFVVEADEYDTAFFDKRSKFVHYHPNTLILNNLEFDHADIFDDLSDIQRQFHHLIRTVPGSGKILVNTDELALAEVLDMGCWTPVEGFSPPGCAAQGEWSVQLEKADGSAYIVCHKGEEVGQVRWGLLGAHNVANGLAAVAAAANAGVEPAVACQALCEFVNAKRRMQLRGEVKGIRVFDDFAHHPTAIQTTLDGLRNAVGEDVKVLAILEPRSNTMKMGVHQNTLADSLGLADRIWLYQSPDLEWDIQEAMQSLGDKAMVMEDIEQILSSVVEAADSGDQIVVMSNGDFAGIHERLLSVLEPVKP